MQDPSKIPSAQVHPRGVSGHAKRAGAKLKNAAFTALAVVIFLSAWGGIAYIKQRLRGTRQPNASERAEHERRAERLEREDWEKRCPGMSASTCKQMHEMRMRPEMREAEARTTRFAKPGLSGAAALGPDGSKYLPPDTQTITQKLWARSPHHADIIDAIRKGRDQVVTIRIRVGPLLRFADEVDAPSIRPALAFDDGGPALTADDEVIATLKATRPLDERGDLDGPAPIIILEAGRPPEQRVSTENSSTAIDP